MMKTMSRKVQETADEEESHQVKMKMKKCRSNVQVTLQEEEVESRKLKMMKMSRNDVQETAHEKSCLVNLKMKKTSHNDDLVTVPVEESRKEILSGIDQEMATKIHQMNWNDLENSFGLVYALFVSFLDSNTAVLPKLFRQRTKCGSFYKGLHLKHIIKRIIYDMKIYL